VIRSQARLTYTRVAAVLSRTETAEITAWREELAALLPQLHRMHALMQQLYRQRVAAGSLDLDLPEALIDLSDEGRSIGVRLLARNDAHRLIEEFMLEANRAAAEFLTAGQIPLPHRIHEPPHPDSIDELNQFLGPFGVHVSYEGRPRPQDIQRLLDQLQGHRLARLLSRQVLRSLTQAQYSTRNAGHFGLAFPLYCHFTSPIRRYPDLLVHRQLAQVLDGDLDRARAEAETLEADSIHCSQAEREAMQAEWAMIDLKKAEFMLGHLLEPEPGTIVSVTPFGFYVELDAYPIEGLVRIDDLTDDRYRFIEVERALCGWRTGQRFRLGDQVVVEATNISLRRRTIDLALLERLGTAAAPRRQRGGVARPSGKKSVHGNRGGVTTPRR
jgi:ribonuclease R